MNTKEAIRIFRKEIECLSHAKCEDCILEKVCDPAKTTPLDSEYIEAYGMAIQALSQEPCTDAVSREDAIEAVKQAIYNHDSAIMRLTELPSVNPQPCEDAVSREAVLDALLDYWHDIQFVDGSGYDVYEDCKAVIDDLPSVTQKSGKWILTIEDWNKWTCSKCGYVKRTDIHVNIGWKYCPNCGADMRGEK